MNQHNLLILERSSNTLDFKSEGGSYVLEGIFGELDKKNRNNRIYTAEEYLPQIESLQEKIKSSKLLGELDHPQKFDISLRNVSHVIEEIHYDQDSKQIRGRIRLLDTDAGKQAKALVDSGIPLHISSRAAGVVESDGKVKIKQLFTYDLVADPGFENAELARVNESYGLANDDLIQIYEIGGVANLLETETKIENNDTNIMENKARFVAVEDFNKYSAYLAEEIKSLKEALAGVSTETIEEKMKALTEYVEYVAERADKGIQYSEYVAEKVDGNIEYSNYLAEKLDQGIEYSEHIAESVNNVKDYANYLAESYNEGVTTSENVQKYLNYLKENIESISEYADYIAETINSNLIVEEEGEEAAKDHEEAADKDELENVGDNSAEGSVDADGEEAGVPAEDIKSDQKEVYSEDDKKELDAADQDAPEDEGEEAAKEVADEVEEGRAFAAAAKEAKDKGEKEFEFDGKKYPVTVKEGAEGMIDAEELESDQEEVNSEDDKKITKQADQEIPSEEDAITDDALEAYKREISEKLSSLINKATEKKTNDPHFFRFVSESTKTRFNELEVEDKTKVLSSIEGRGYLTESQIVTLMEGALVEVAGQATPYFVEAAPAEYKEIWNTLSEAKRNQLSAQAKMVKLTTPYQVANFWQTRDLREVSQVMEKLTMITEARKEEAPKKSIGYDVTGIGEEIAKRFKK
jgi:hypothetical protein